MHKSLGKLNQILKYLISLLAIVLTVLSFIPNSGFPKIGSYLVTILLPFTMDLMRFFGVKISQRFELAYLIFIIPAMVLGIDFDWYKLIPPFDKIVHGASGALAAFAAAEIIEQSITVHKRAAYALISISFVAFTAAIWECFEFSYDKLFDGHMQQLISVGLDDTMWDIIVALIGGAIATVFIFGKKSVKER